jgi:diguanylate cyclase (GGDEF)-like protein
MSSASLSENERERLAALHEYDILDTPRDPSFDSLTTLAAQICDAPIALFSLIDGQRQWFKSNHGLAGIPQTPRDAAFCAHTILGDDILEVPDTRQDARFHDSFLVTAEPGIRFYAGMPLRDGRGFGLGALCVMDHRPRQLSVSQRLALESLARLAIALLEQRRGERKLRESERRATELAYAARFDALTGLPHRQLFRDRIAQAIARAARKKRPIAVVVLNLDGFKLVNNGHGHAAGDRVLIQVAERLISCVSAYDTVSRLGADEFAIALSNIDRVEEAGPVVQRVLHTLAQPFELEDGETFISATAGVSVFDADGSDANTLIKNAELAMHRAREQGRNFYEFFAPEMNQRGLERMHLERGLRRALERGEFLLHYQPKVSAATGKIRGAEALVRWQHPERGLVLPGEFIPILEETGLITPVGLWALESACAQIRRWERAGIEVECIGINLSARQFQQPNFDVHMRRVIESSGISPGKIELEITESVLMHDPAQAIQTLGRLKQLGVSLSVDDFGTGYSGLSYLKQLPLDSLKIARNFICNIPHDPDDAAIALAIINLAHNLGLRVVAEGVETEAQARYLAAHSCDYLQGFYFSLPLDADAYGRLQLTNELPGLPKGSGESGLILPFHK